MDVYDSARLTEYEHYLHAELDPDRELYIPLPGPISLTTARCVLPSANGTVSGDASGRLSGKRRGRDLQREEEVEEEWLEEEKRQGSGE